MSEFMYLSGDSTQVIRSDKIMYKYDLSRWSKNNKILKCGIMCWVYYS